MITARLVLQCTALINLLLGAFVLMTQPGRPQNRLFCVFSTVVTLWAICMAMIPPLQDPDQAALLIRVASYIAAWLPLAFYALCLAMAGAVESGRALIRRTRWMFLLSQAAGLLCFTPFYLTKATIAAPDAAAWHPPAPDWGPAFPLYNLYFLVAFLWILYRFVAILRRSRGVQRTELQFVVLGMSTTLVFTLTTNVITPWLTGSSRLQPLGPLGFLAMNAIMAYGIATRRVLDVAMILRRTAAYTLLATYLGLLYAATIMGTQALWTYLVGTAPPTPVPYALGLVIVLLSISPAEGIMQRLARRLFITLQPLDVRDIVRRASLAMQSITTLDALLSDFSNLVVSSMECERVVILRAKGDLLEQIYAHPAENTPPIVVAMGEPLARSLRVATTPMVLDTMRRHRQPPLLTHAAEALAAMGMNAAVAVRLKGEIQGLMLLGPRISGRIYGAHEEEAIQILANELGIAIDNATLYTEVRNSDIYNNILLNSLVSGVIAVNSEHRVTIFNREAHRILRLDAGRLLNRPMAEIPAPLRRLLQETLDSGSRIEEQEFDIPLPDRPDSIQVRAGGAVFHAHTGQPLGALIVFHDISQIRIMEAQMRRQDRLASMGTLSAGMAHEIKNPLVTIKTFTQLLPERYEDAEFRHSFTDLVGHEVLRIDGIVNQLLAFARPSKPSLCAIQMHTVLTESLRLVAQQMQQAGVRVTKDFSTPNDHVMGDAALLNQAFINFFLNAKEAMPDGGTLHVATAEAGDRAAMPRRRRWDGRGQSHRHLQIRIADTGTGIAEKDLIRVFDPFFTTKSSGTGLGLSVSHGIIQEQGGWIDVESQVGQGAVFTIYFPIPAGEQQA